MRGAFLACAIWSLTVPVGAAAEAELAEVYADDFEKGMDRWEPAGGEPSFAIIEDNGPDGKKTHVLRALGNSKFKTDYRSPPNIAVLTDVNVGDFELNEKVKSTRPEAGPHRDLCIVWGYQDPNHFYYVHFGATNTPDTNSCRIFVVDNADRKPISLKQPAGTPWVEGWIDVKVTRDVATGETKVYFNDMDEPLMTALDDRFKWGRVGLGTFDDHGNFEAFSLKGVEVKPETAATK
jgi:hypothetical protein